MPTIQHPEFVILDGERYPIARDKKGARLWRETRVPVQPGGGERTVTFDTWDLGFGHSRLSIPGTYEYGVRANTTARWKLTMGPEQGAVTAASGHAFYRLVEYQGYIYALGETTATDNLYFARIQSDGTIAAEGECTFNTTTFTPPASGDDGQINQSDNESYAECRGADPDGKTAIDDGEITSIGQLYDHDTTTWMITRTYMRFNTATIPDGASATSAKLRIYIAYDYATTSEFTVIVKKHIWSGGGLTTADWRTNAEILADTTLGTSASTSTLSAPQWFEITLDASEIVKDGYTEMYLLSSRDAADGGTDPKPNGANGSERIRPRTLEYDSASKAPELIVEYDLQQADGPPGQPAAWEGELYVGVTDGLAYKVTAKSDSGTANVAVTCGANTLTDSREAWTINEWIGTTITCDGNTMTVASNTADTLTGVAAWSASQPGDGKAWTLTGAAWVLGAACDALHFCRVGRDMWGVPLGTKGKISKLPAGATWATAWGTDDTAVGTSPWGALYGVGDTGKDIASLHEWGRWIHVGKPDGFFNGDSEGNLWNQIPEVIESSKNCLRLEKWQGMMWPPTILGLYRYAGMGARTQGPEVIDSNASAIRGGYFTALAKAGHWIYGAYKAQDGNTYILTGRLRESHELGVGEVVWHGYLAIYDSTYTINDMLVSTVTSPPCLWIVHSGGTSNVIHYFILNQDGSINPADSGYRSNTTSTQVYLPRIDLDSPGTTKAGHFIEVHTGGTLESAKKWVKLYANWDGGGWNQVDDPIEDVGTTFTRLYWTAGTNDTGRSLQLRVDLDSDATNARPEVEKITVNLIESPRREPAIRCSLRVANTLDKARSAKKMEEDLNALDNGSTYTMTDPDDPAAGTVSVIVHDMEFIPRETPGEIQGERICNLTLRTVHYS